MSSHFNYWTTCPTFKWSDNLVNYHRLVRYNAAVRISHDSHLEQSCTQPSKCSVAFKSQNDTHFSKKFKILCIWYTSIFKIRNHLIKKIDWN